MIVNIKTMAVKIDALRIVNLGLENCGKSKAGTNIFIMTIAKTTPSGKFPKNLIRTVRSPIPNAE
jgi:hypothetical protein